ncbi:beta-lactam-binding protein with PASTA domain [Anaerosolibacter carboniphilus]|uniref:Beta-lactam-binding protein with PASTA domain n=1 Tax=Anaerosolibacter carboniphilus TaxID=1417629 RepID=A0A841KSY3_9FIRM|nr:hypothetical protein [Anaerosolibacter carboniphilus]MBB6216511.1 beta-lactam-binding protein with PASTA domain [Anaerosolibacter carboniphilus]
MNTPDVVGFTLESAKTELSKFNRDVRVFETFAPKEKTTIGECRVVKQVIHENWIELIVSYF